MNNDFNKYINANEKATNQVATKPQNEVTHKPKQSLIDQFLTQVVSYAEKSGENLDSKTKSLAVEIITATNKSIMGNSYNWSDIDVAGCGLISQIKRWAKLGVTMEDKLYPDIRRNGKTNKFDIMIKPQYQTVEKLVVNYFSLEVLRFKEDVICIGDEVFEEEDFSTGLSKITGHKRNNEVDRNNLDNITGAYKIMYVKDHRGEINQYVIRIDKNRIMRAYNASASKEKTVWKQDTRKMILKTVTWEMWNDKNVRAFMKFPDDIIQDLSVIEDTNEMDWNAETKFSNVNQAQENVQVNVASEDVIDMKYEDDEE